MRPLHFRYLISLLIGLCLATTAFAGPVEDATARMKERLPQIDNLKASGSVGEAISGFLVPRTELGPRHKALVEAENADRKTVYEAVANRTGQTSEEVGTQRAIRIAELARKGVWLQQPDGSWYQKP